MHILLIEYDLYLPSAHSLKEKRSIVKRILNEVRRDFNVSISEVEHLDLWQSCGLAVVCVGNLKAALENIERRITERIESNEVAQLSGMRTQWL